MCQGKFDTGREVKNDVALINSTYSRVYGDVCSDCIKRLAKLIDQEFPRNKVLLKKEEQVVAGVQN